MLILLWLLPPVVVACAAMAWVGWLGREGRGEVDPDIAVRRLAGALERERPRRPVVRTPVVGAAVSERPADRSTGVAVRRSQETRRRAS